MLCNTPRLSNDGGDDYPTRRSTPLGIAVQEGHLEAARALIDAGAAIDAVPRGQDGKEQATSLARLAADMRRGDMVSLLARAIIDRDSSETWTREWAASTGFTAGNLGAAVGAVGAAAAVGAAGVVGGAVASAGATASRSERARRRSFLSEGKGRQEVLGLGETQRSVPGRRGLRRRAGL